MTLKLESLEDRRLLAVLSVDDGGTADYSDIQAAVDAADSGDVIRIHDGDYSPFTVGQDKDSLRIRAIEPGTAVIDAGLAVDYGVQIEGDNTTLVGLYVTGGLRGGIHVESDGNRIVRNVAENNGDFGIGSIRSDNNVIFGNQVIDNGIAMTQPHSGNGIWVFEGTGNRIVGNFASGNGIGYRLGGDQLLVRNNTAVNDIMAIAGGSGHRILHNEMLNDGAVDWTFGMAVRQADNSVIAGNYISGYRYGLSLFDGAGHVVRDNVLTDNRLGGLLLGFGLNDSKFTGNLFIDNQGSGIEFVGDSKGSANTPHGQGNLFSGNAFEGNGQWGMYFNQIESAIDNIFADNECDDNVLGSSNVEGVC